MSPADLPAEVWAVIRRVVSEAPPMTDEQRANIVALFRAGDARTGDRGAA
ncbi:hypothetical protein P5V93_15220 [Mycobacteroides abscessus subsp. abscessus]|nr:hypothetical protein [Mycobacteroides abscessus]MDM2173835.1 hypothetical protein [Mycobacteroides abscessus]MDM2178999.1 hypothetical protein [Mycobacteroides abscessus]MDM2208514.1 hypothetical protein [Mycobacteroides abscessus]MDM2212975.1 hypothetical protein [Mycobacteroides abscessus]MDM2232758.1 hypothetical protein [Mycobacteroides abscessus]